MKRTILTLAMASMLSSCGVGYYSTTVIEPIPSPRPVHTTVNIALQPSWGPAGYDYVMFYYFPEFNFYYDVEHAMFHYLNYGRWVSAKMLPRGRHFPTDLHRYYKVVINQRNPWNYNRQHKRQYKHYKGVYNQRNLRDERSNRPHENPRTDTQRRIPYQSTPSQHNPSNGTQHNPNYGQGMGAGVGQGTPYRGDQGKQNKGGQNSISRPKNSQRNNNTQGNVGQGRQNNSSKSGNTNNRNSSSQSSRSSGSRSTGSRGR